MSKKTVLIVDDAYSMRSLLKKALKEVDYEVVGEAKNGKEGLELYFETKPDIVTMDINMPDMSGIEVTKQILAKDPNAKIIAVTGNSDEEKKRQMIEAGVLDYLKKPFQPAFLWNKLDKIFSKEDIEKSSFAEPKKEDTIKSTNEHKGIDDSLEIEIMTKPDDKKPDIIEIENEETLFQFPDNSNDYNDENKLCEENLLRQEQKQHEMTNRENKDFNPRYPVKRDVLQTKENNSARDEKPVNNFKISELRKPIEKINSDSTPVRTEKEEQHENNKQRLLRAELQARTKPEDLNKIKNDSDVLPKQEINIRPPKRKVLDEISENIDNISDINLNKSSDLNYDNSTNQKPKLLKVVRKIFKK